MNFLNMSVLVCIVHPKRTVMFMVLSAFNMVGRRDDILEEKLIFHESVNIFTLVANGTS